MQKLTLKLYPGWSKGTLSVASSEQRSQNRISLPEETVHQNLATPYKRRSSVTRMPRRKASFVVSSKTILVDLPDCQWQPRSVSTCHSRSTPKSSLLSFQKATSSGLRQDPGSQRGLQRRRGHPRNRPRRLACLSAREQQYFAPSVFTLGYPRVVSR